MTAPVFVVERLDDIGGQFVLDGPEGRHAVSVKRLQPGRAVVDGNHTGRRLIPGTRRARPALRWPTPSTGPRATSATTPWGSSRARPR